MLHRETGDRCPLRDATVRGVPLLACDLWEHAYYLKYQSDVEAYVEDWLRHVDWKRVSELYTLAEACPKL